VLEVENGVFAFTDAWPAKRLATKRLKCVLTIRDGKIAYQSEAASEALSTSIYDVLLKNGHVIDPANHRDGRFDVAIAGGKIAGIGTGLPAAAARVVVDAGDYLVAPGLIEISATYQPDYRTLPNGVTTLVVAGSPATQPAAHAKTRVLIMPSVPAAQADERATTVEQTIERGTAIRARAIGRPELGTLSEGADADIALFDAGTAGQHCVLTLRNGAVVWDSAGLTTMDWIKAGPYTNFR